MIPSLETLLLSLVLTEIIELLCAASLFRIRGKKDVFLILLVNVITNPLVVILYYALYPVANHTVLTAVLEVSAVLCEAVYYKKYAESVRNPMLFSVSMNAASYFIGYIINMLIR